MQEAYLLNLDSNKEMEREMMDVERENDLRRMTVEYMRFYNIIIAVVFGGEIPYQDHDPEYPPPNEPTRRLINVDEETGISFPAFYWLSTLNLMYDQKSRLYVNSLDKIQDLFYGIIEDWDGVITPGSEMDENIREMHEFLYQYFQIPQPYIGSDEHYDVESDVEGDEDH